MLQLPRKDNLTKSSNSNPVGRYLSNLTRQLKYASPQDTVDISHLPVCDFIYSNPNLYAERSSLFCWK